MRREAPVAPEDLYPLYLARLREIRLAMHRQDSEALRLLELELGSLPDTERHVLAMAIHDVAARRPRLAKTHFVRVLRDEASRARPAPPALAATSTPVPAATPRSPGRRPERAPGRRVRLAARVAAF